MLNLGPSEIILIFALALLLFGPEKLPELARMLARVFRETRRVTHELQTTFQDTLGGLDKDGGPGVSEFKRIAQSLDPREIFSESPARAQFASPPPQTAHSDVAAGRVVASVPGSTPVGASMPSRRVPLDQMPPLATLIPPPALGESEVADLGANASSSLGDRDSLAPVTEQARERAETSAASIPKAGNQVADSSVTSEAKTPTTPSL